MSASNKSWLMVGGLVLAAFAVIYATQRINGGSAPPAEIAPTTLTADTDAEPGPTRSRTHFPTILRAKPVHQEPASSPRYTPPNESIPRGEPHFDGASQATFHQPRLPATPVPRDRGDTGSPAFLGPPTGQAPLPLADDALRPEPDKFEQPGAASPDPSRVSPTTALPSLPNGLPSPVNDNTAPDNTAPDKTAPESASASNNSGTYVTVADDSFWAISKRQYGEGRFFKALYYHNRQRVERPDRIPGGIQLETPALAKLQRMYPDLCRPGQRN